MRYHIGNSLALFALLLIAACGSSSPITSTAAKSQTVSTSDTNVVDSVSAMDTGDLYYIDFDSSGSAEVSFSGGASSAKYSLIVQSTESSSSSVAISAKDLSADLPGQFDMMLREAEANLPVSEEVDQESSLSKSMTSQKAVAIGDRGSFRVLSSITSTTRYTEVSATVRCIDDHIIVYVDTTVPSTSLSESDIETLCGQFEYAVALEESVLGEPSDVNGDGHVITLITRAVNRLGASGGGIITGYWYAADTSPRTSSNVTSNYAEIIYILAPDPDGVDGTTISREFAMSNLMTAVVPHEVQHAISYNQHVLVNGGSTESSWLNEAMSHFIEDYTGFGQENYSRVEVYFELTESVSLAPSSSPDLAERGAGYLFLRYLYERAADPNAFLAALEDTNLTGQDNIEAAFGREDAGFDEWNEFMRRWAIAVALTNTGISRTAQYQFNDRIWNSTTSHWQGICLICTTEDGRGTILYGPNAPEISGSSVNLSLAGTATAFYTVSSPPSSITLSGNASAGLQGVLIRTE